MTKSETGAVVYNPGRCIGCRYCMVACTFQIPAYEYNNALTPKVRKCEICHNTIAKEGGVPACAEACPREVITFGKRSDIVELARKKMEKHPGRYADHVYGEHEAGGTSWMYLASSPFEQIGFAKIGDKPVPALSEAVQHTIFKHFIPPLALYGTLGAAMWTFHRAPIARGRTRRVRAIPRRMRSESERRLREVSEDGLPDSHRDEAPPTPVRKKFFTPGVMILSTIMVIGLLYVAYRYIYGLGAVTNLDDQHPWGLWIGVDVASGVALSAGGFTTAALVHIFRRDAYESITRPALLTAMLGYTFVAAALLVDLGRYYNIWHPLVYWQGNSVLFEVGMCVMFYLIVLYIEFIPVVYERFIGRVNLPSVLALFNGLVDWMLRVARAILGKVLWFFIIVGVVLSCLHQSSLGSLLLIAPYKLHPLWYTPLLPLLFLLSAIAVGFPMVVVESGFACNALDLKFEKRTCQGLAGLIPYILAIYLALKLGDMWVRQTYVYLLDNSYVTNMFLVEILVGIALPFVMFLLPQVRRSGRWMFIASLLVVGGVLLNRVNVYIIGYNPPFAQRAYVPSFGEFAVTLGLAAALILLYRLFVTVFPVISAEPRRAVRTPEG